MFSLQDPKGNIATFMKEKEALIYKSEFLKPAYSISLKPRVRARIA